MCWSVYIATSKPLCNVRFTRDNPPGAPPLLHFEEVAHDPELGDNLCRPLFAAPYLYYVGSSSGCSCHLTNNGHLAGWNDNMPVYEWYPSCAVFLDFIQRHTQYEPLEMYAVWEDEWDAGLAAQPVEYRDMDASLLTMDTYFGLTSRYFYRFKAWGIAPPEANIPRFLNVDLDVAAESDLQPLISFWENRLLPLVLPADTGSDTVRFQCITQPEDPAAAIHLFCEAVEALPPDLTEFWCRCPVRKLDIGYDSGQEQPYCQSDLPGALLTRAMRYFTGIGITVYPL